MVPSRVISLGAVLAAVTVFATTATGHYLWVSVDAKSGEKGTVNVYFEEAAAPGDGKYLAPFAKNGTTWIRTVADPKPVVIPMKETKRATTRWLTAPAPASAPRSIDSYGKFGVYRYGKTDVLLHYYARHLDVETHDDLHELSRAKQLELDVVPHDDGDKMELTILWKGKPAVDRIVHVRGPKSFQENPKTDQQGKVVFAIKEPGNYVFRTYVEEGVAGKDDGQDYSLIRHHATMSMTLPLKK